MLMSSDLDHELDVVDKSEGAQKHAMWNRMFCFSTGWESI